MAIKENEVVSLQYTVVDTSINKEVDSNIGREPLEFITGKSMIIPGLENKVVELNKDDKADIVVNPEDAYGEYRDDLNQTLPREQFAGVELKEGMTLYGTDDNGQTAQVLVKSFTDENVSIDYNHQLAGKTLMFSVTILDVRAATEEEIASGVIGGASSEGGCCGGGHCDTPEEEPEVVDNSSCCGGGHCS
jgi:FKBP-type peptidyl-prolyl cis-trans isomerase SlyD